MRKLFEVLHNTISAGKDAVLCSVIASSGSTPRGAGAKMIVLSDGTSYGTIGGGVVEHACILQAASVHVSRASLVKGFDLSANDKAELGMICGGRATVYFQFLGAADAKTRSMLTYAMELFSQQEDAWLITVIQEDSLAQMGIYAGGALHFLEGREKSDILPHACANGILVNGEPAYYIEPLVSSSRTYIFGGGHVAQALVPVIAGVGFAPVVFDDRERFTDPALFPGAQATILGDFSRIHEYLTVKPHDYIIIMTRAHGADYIVLEQALRTDATYVGIIGSQTKMAATHAKLLAAGIDPSSFARIHNPIGLPILAETPAEIAISVAAELIEHRARVRRQ